MVFLIKYLNFSKINVFSICDKGVKQSNEQSNEQSNYTKKLFVSN